MRFVAGRDAAAKSHREDAAGRGAAAKSYREDAAGRSSMGELLAGAPWQSCWPRVPWRRGLRHCGKEPSGRCCWPGRRGEVTGRGAAVAEILLARSAVAELLAGNRRKA